jgi:hypothetical protein
MERGRMTEFGDIKAGAPMKRIEIPDALLPASPDPYWPEDGTMGKLTAEIVAAAELEMRSRLDDALARINAQFAEVYPDLAARGFCLDWADMPLLDGH